MGTDRLSGLRGMTSCRSAAAASIGLQKDVSSHRIFSVEQQVAHPCFLRGLARVAVLLLAGTEGEDSLMRLIGAASRCGPSCSEVAS